MASGGDLGENFPLKTSQKPLILLAESVERATGIEPVYQAWEAKELSNFPNVLRGTWATWLALGWHSAKGAANYCGRAKINGGGADSMPITVTGWNPFYEGWLAALLGADGVVPNVYRRAVDREGWTEGYRTALETPSLVEVRAVLLAEYKHEHVRIEGNIIVGP